MNNHTDLINKLVTKFNLKKYLEIGVRNPDDNLNLIKASVKVGVDPYPEKPVTYKKTSNEFFEFFANNDTFFDIIFIDGLHTEYQSFIDIEKSMGFLNDGGFIVVHDCNPPTEYHVRPYGDYKNTGGEWNGGVYKSFINIRKHYPKWKSFVVDFDFGVGVITKNKKIYINNENNLNNIDDLTWDYFDKNRKKLLNLISIDEFLAIIDNG